MKYRLVVNFDLEALSLTDAYEKLMKHLLPPVVIQSYFAPPAPDISFETSDEFYVDGELGDPEDLSAATIAVLQKNFP